MDTLPRSTKKCLACWALPSLFAHSKIFFGSHDSALLPIEMPKTKLARGMVDLDGAYTQRFQGMFGRIARRFRATEKPVWWSGMAISLCAPLSA